MNPGWLTQLAPDHAPPPPGWWPPAPGWWLLALLLAAGIAGAVLWWRSPARRQRRAALRMLSSIERSGADPAQCARATQSLLRRYALARFGTARVGHLSGEAWLAFVVEHGGQHLAGGSGRALLIAAWGGAAADRRADWLAGARGFLRHAVRRRRIRSK